MNTMETKETLHQYILDRMDDIGEVSKETFAKVMEDDPTLMTRYVNATGLQCLNARIVDMDGDDLIVLITFETGEPRIGKICFIS